MTESTTTDRSLFAFWSHLESILRPPVRPTPTPPSSSLQIASTTTTTPTPLNGASQLRHGTTTDTSVEQVLPSIVEKSMPLDALSTNTSSLNSSDEIFKCLNVCNFYLEKLDLSIENHRKICQLANETSNKQFSLIPRGFPRLRSQLSKTFYFALGIDRKNRSIMLS